jgi:hypothetical protein
MSEIFRDAIITGFKVATPILHVSILWPCSYPSFRRQHPLTSNHDLCSQTRRHRADTDRLRGWMLQQMVDLVNRIFEFIGTSI